MKKILYLITISLIITLTACQKNKEYDIVTTAYFQYDIVKNIVDDKLEINLLTKPGIDNHDFLPSSKQMSSIKNSKLFIFTSYEIDAWLNENVTQVVGKNTSYLNLSEYVEYDELEENHDHGDDDHLDHDHNHGIHYWTDPILILEFIELIKDEIIKIDPKNSDTYIQNANIYYNKIFELNEEITNYFLNKENVKLYFAGHNAMQHFEHRYNIEIVSLSDTNKPDADLTSAQISKLIKEIKDNNVKYLFTEELKEPKVANTIKLELAKENYDLILLELHGYHNITKNQFDEGITYYDLLLKNFNNIKKALGE